jgi:uncharacterized membrane protein
MRHVLQALAVSVVFLLLIPAARAQDTGGSFGGGSWDSGDSGGGGGGGGDYSSSGSDYSYSGSSNDYYSYSGGSSPSNTSYSSGGSGRRSSGGELVFMAIGAVVLGIGWLWGNWKGSGGSVTSYTGGSYVPQNQADVTVLRFGLDARVRPYVQKELDRIAKSADTKTKPGLVKSLGEVALMLRRIRDTWVYGGAFNEPMRPMQDSHATFQKHVAAARSTFRHELVRNADGETTTAEAPDHVRLTEEGPGIVLVTIIVAAKQELFTVNRIGDGDDLRRALEVLSALTSQILVAMEIVWTPADPDDRMSSVELEALVPDGVFPIRGAMVGKVICSYCAGPFPLELMSCPHCGAPAAGSPQARTA